MCRPASRGAAPGTVEALADVFARDRHAKRFKQSHISAFSENLSTFIGEHRTLVPGRRPFHLIPRTGNRRSDRPKWNSREYGFLCRWFEIDQQGFLRQVMRCILVNGASLVMLWGAKTISWRRSRKSGNRWFLAEKALAALVADMFQLFFAVNTGAGLGQRSVVGHPLRGSLH